MQPALELVEAFVHRAYGWRYKARLGDRGARAADEVLDVAKLTRTLLASADTFHEHAVEIANQAQGDRKTRAQPVLHSAHVVEHFSRVTNVLCVWWRCTNL